MIEVHDDEEEIADQADDPEEGDSQDETIESGDEETLSHEGNDSRPLYNMDVLEENDEEEGEQGMQIISSRQIALIRPR